LAQSLQLYIEVES